ncbi:MAG TPA: hypothetical protein VLM05_13825 [Mycobacteriales bacterium]|nr:hypothetical protein [Mycobacteriales bacterium]
MVMVSLADVHCSEETDEVGSDEPYVLVTAVNLRSSVNVAGFPVPLPSCEVVRYGPFNDTDEGDTPRAGFAPFWAGAFGAPDDAIFIVSLMENDDGDPEALRGIVKGAATSSLFAGLNQPRPQKVAALLRDVNSAMGVPTGAPNFDDKVGGPQELAFTPDELGKARAGQLVSKSMPFSGDGGRYTVRFEASPDIFGAIRDRWIALGASASPVGVPLSGEAPTFDGTGRAQVFSAGTISWHPTIGAHAVWGAIGGRWLAIGRERFGYPVNDESPAAAGGRFNDFRAVHLPGQPMASIYWTAGTGAHEVYGAIRDMWLRNGGAGGRLGYPLDAEHDNAGGRRQTFQHGSIFWTPQHGAVIQ